MLFLALCGFHFPGAFFVDIVAIVAIALLILLIFIYLHHRQPYVRPHRASSSSECWSSFKSLLLVIVVVVVIITITIIIIIITITIPITNIIVVVVVIIITITLINALSIIHITYIQRMFRLLSHPHPFRSPALAVKYRPR